jgi:hypothetical protein
MIVTSMDRLPTRSARTDRLERIQYPVSSRLARMRALSRLMDNSITLPGGYRIGIDPLLGLLPGIGDFLASTLSLWLIYDAARLGIQKRILMRMVVNVLFDTLTGSIPVLGDIVDATWKANARNMRLVEMNYGPATRERPLAKLIGVFLLAAVCIYGALFTVLYLIVQAVLSLFR